MLYSKQLLSSQAPHLFHISNFAVLIIIIEINDHLYHFEKLMLCYSVCISLYYLTVSIIARYQVCNIIKVLIFHQTFFSVNVFFFMPGRIM